MNLVRLSEHVIDNSNGVATTCYLYKNNEIIATGKHYNPLETPYPYGYAWLTYVFADKTVFWKRGPYPVGEGDGMYQHIIYKNGIETFHVPTKEALGSIEYRKDTNEIVGKSMCYHEDPPDFGLPTPITNTEDVIAYTVNFDTEDNPLSWEAYVWPR